MFCFFIKEYQSHPPPSHPSPSPPRPHPAPPPSNCHIKSFNHMLARRKSALNPRWFTLLTDLRRYPGVSLTLCCFLVYSTRRFVVCLPFAILFLCFSVLLALRLPRLGKRELILVLFVCLIDLCLFRFVGFLFLLMEGLRFVIVALPGLFSYLFLQEKKYIGISVSYMTKHMSPVSAHLVQTCILFHSLAH